MKVAPRYRVSKKTEFYWIEHFQIFHKYHKYFFPTGSRISKCSIWQNSRFFWDTLYVILIIYRYKSLCPFLISLKNLLLLQSCNKTQCHISLWFDSFTNFVLHTRRRSVYCLVIFSLQMPQFFMSSFLFYIWTCGSSWHPSGRFD